MIRRVFLAFLVFGLVACGDDGVAPEVTIIGTWEFESITSDNGTVTAEPHTLTFTATTVTLVFTAGDCTEIANYTLDDDGTLTATVTAVSGADCQDMIGDVVVFQVTVTSDTLTLVQDFPGTTVTQLFRRVN